MNTKRAALRRRAALWIGVAVGLAGASLLWAGVPDVSAVAERLQARRSQAAFARALRPTAARDEGGPAVGVTYPPLLRVLASNPRYFTDGSGKAVYLTGSHTWSNLIDNGGGNPPPVFDYTAYLNWLTSYGHNFFRLWTWEQARWTVETSDEEYYFGPFLPFARAPGGGDALDGMPRFDLNVLENQYFSRLRARVEEAGARGFYVSVMLFDGWSIAKNKDTVMQNNPWRGHPFNRLNNLNGIDGDPDGDDSGLEVHQLVNPAVLDRQKAYVRRVVETLNDLDHVLYEISNESDGSATQWQYELINFVKGLEAALPKQHPVGMTAQWPGGTNQDLYASPADWISPAGDVNNPPLADGRKVVLSDTDHLCGVCGDRRWLWKSFTRGENPIFMDVYDGAGYGVGAAGFMSTDPVFVSVRQNLGWAKRYADRMNLAAAVPSETLASTGYALASMSTEIPDILVYQPAAGGFTVDLTDTRSDFLVEWFDPETGQTREGGRVTGGRIRVFTPPFSADAVLYLKGI